MDRAALSNRALNRASYSPDNFGSGPLAPRDAKAEAPAATQTRRRRYADFVETSKIRATSTAETPCSNSRRTGNPDLPTPVFNWTEPMSCQQPLALR